MRELLRTHQESSMSPGELSKYRLARKAVGLSALASQLLHPEVAAGVLQHSRVMTDPARRLMNTETFMHLLCHGTPDQRDVSASVIRHIHETVKGSIPLMYKHGSQVEKRLVQYDAGSQSGQEWVAMTLIMNKIKIGEVMGVSIKPEQINDYIAYYAHSLAPIGLRTDAFPQTYEELKERYFGIIHTTDLSEEAKVITGNLIHIAPTLIPSFLGIHETDLSRLDKATLATINQLSGVLKSQTRILTAGFLEPELREKYEMKWGKKEEELFRMQKFLLRWASSYIRLSDEIDPATIKRLENYRTRIQTS